MKVTWDFSEFEDFAKRLENSDHGYETALMTATKEIAKVLHQYLLNLTPVKTGNLRKMWSAGDNLAFIVEKVENGYMVTLINEAENEKGFQYGLAVNDGHFSSNGGWVVGRFFVQDSITATKPKIEQIVMKELQKWWDSV